MKETHETYILKKNIEYQNQYIYIFDVKVENRWDYRFLSDPSIIKIRMYGHKHPLRVKYQKSFYE